MSENQWKGYAASTAGSILLVAEFVLWPVLGFGRVNWLAAAGVVLLLVGLAFAVLPALELRRRGGMAEGGSFGDTTRLVDTGLYSVVRHPQYLSWPVMSLALILITQHWIVAVTGAVSVILLAIDLGKSDSEGLEKFGDAYREYMARVPGWNPIAGVWRVLRRGR